MSEWASHSTYDIGKANAGHILVCFACLCLDQLMVLFNVITQSPFSPWWVPPEWVNLLLHFIIIFVTTSLLFLRKYEKRLLFRRFEYTDCGLNQVFDRKSKRIVEELIDAKIVLAMRAIYQSRMGLALIDTGMFLNPILGLMACHWSCRAQNRRHVWDENLIWRFTLIFRFVLHLFLQ